jgi:hypothetical protein
MPTWTQIDKEVDSTTEEAAWGDSPWGSGAWGGGVWTKVGKQTDSWTTIEKVTDS